VLIIEETEVKNVVIIPIYHPDNKFLRLLDRLKIQQNITFDIYIIDSDYDTDFEFYKDHLDGLSTVVKKISSDEFNHGTTRQKAAKDCANYPILIYMTQDAIPANENTLTNLVKTFDNEKVGCAYGRQLPHLDATILASRERTFNYLSESKLKQLSDVKTLGIKVSFLSDTFAAYRNTVLNEIGNFPNDIIMGEDTYVASKMILEGWIVAYCADAQVYHSHNYTIMQEFRRYFDIGVFHAREPWIRKHFGQAESEGKKFLLAEIKYFIMYYPWLLPVMIVHNGIKFIGYRLGLKENNLSLRIKQRCSMMPNYWKNKE